MKAFGVGWILCALLLAGGMLFFYTPALADSHRPMLPDVYHEQDISGWWMSEKLDGVRGYWDGEQLWSKNGHLLFPPDEFTDGFPPFPLEGELWKGRNSFEQTASIVQREEPHRGWMGLKFAVFDAPATGKTFRQRLARIKGWLKKNPAGMLIVIEQVPVQDLQHLQSELTRIEALGGEGLIVRDPDALYNAGRSTGILKVKSFQDAEATVIAHLPGKGNIKADWSAAGRTGQWSPISDRNGVQRL